MARFNVDPFSAPPAGHSLTEDNTKWPWGNPPRMADPNQVLDMLVDKFEGPKRRQELFKMMLVGVSIETIVEGVIYQGFTEGAFSPDVGLLIKGPLGIILANMAEEEDIPYRLFENEDVLEEGTMNDKTFMTLMKSNNPQMFGFIREALNKSIREGSNKKPQEDNFLDTDRETDK